MASTRHALSQPAIDPDRVIGAGASGLLVAIVGLAVVVGWAWAAAAVLILIGVAAAVSGLVAQAGRKLPRGDGAPLVADPPPWGPA